MSFPIKIVALICLASCLSTISTYSQALDISTNLKYNYLDKELSFSENNCQPELKNKTHQKFYDLSSCQSPLRLKIHLSNSSEDLQTSYLYLNNSDVSDLSKGINSEFYKITVSPKQDTIIRLSITNLANLKLRPILLGDEYYKFIQRDKSLNKEFSYLNLRTKINSLTLGFFISFIVFTLFFLIQTRTKEFLFYLIYQLANIVYFSDLYWLTDKVSTEWITMDSYRTLVKTTSQPLIYFFYYIFLRYFLETKTKLQKIDSWLRILEKSFLLVCLISLISFFLNEAFFFSFQNISRYYMSIVGLAILIYFAFNRDRLINYMLWGGSFLFIGTMLAFYFSITPGQIPWAGIYPLDFMIGGTIIEFFIFSFGLSYKIQLKNKKYSIIQTELNKQLLDSQSERERKLELLTDKLTQAETDRRIMAVQLKSLRSQLNPHFLFNSLNSLKKYILKSEITSATHYIDRFASLIRKMLSSSRKNLISLKDEIEALSIYLELENERLGFDLQWSIVVDESLDIDEVMIPPILIQPFVENAIWHGLINKAEGTKELTIKFEDKQPLEITILDNGIGINAAKEIQTTVNREKHKSLGTKMIQERIALIKRFYKVDAALVINKTPESGGTEIKIILPEIV